jgi:hypothetical protein
MGKSTDGSFREQWMGTCATSSDEQLDLEQYPTTNSATDPLESHCRTVCPIGKSILTTATTFGDIFGDIFGASGSGTKGWVGQI